MKEVIVTCNPDGTIKIEALGFTGNACEKATAEIEKALGHRTGQTKKPEFFQGNKATQKAGR